MASCAIDFVIYNIVGECMCLAYSVNYIPVKLMYIMYFLNSLLYIIECVYFSECFRHSFLTVVFNGNYFEIIIYQILYLFMEIVLIVTAIF